MDTARAEWSGEAEFDSRKAAEEVDFWLSNGFTGVGELLGMLPDKKRRLSIDGNICLLWPILEVCQAHEAPAGCCSVPDWGASISYHYFGKDTTIYASTPPLEPPTELPLHIDWNLRQVMGLEISEEDRARILGLNMARLCKLDAAKLQEQKEARYGEQISWDEVSLKWSPEDEAQPAPAGGRTESEGEPVHG